MIRQIKLCLAIASILAMVENLFAQNSRTLMDTDSTNTDRLQIVLLSGGTLYSSGLFYLNYVWYKDHEAVPFHFYNDLTGWLQLDKAGHIFVSYYESYYGIKALQWAGVSRKKAIWLGGSLGFLMQTPIEIFDGFYEGYGFSASDIVANTLGSALAISQELAWDEQRIALKFSYTPTKYPRYNIPAFGESNLAQFFTDYNGHTYWLSANPSSFWTGRNIPKWLNLAIGYGGDGMLAEFENPRYKNGVRIPEFERNRQWYLSLDVDLKSIPVHNIFLKRVLSVLNMIKIPAPALELNSSDGIALHLIHF